MTTENVMVIVVNHLWQSTLFALLMVGLALLLRRNGARVRKLLWCAASMKFLVLFAGLAALSTQIPLHPAAGNHDDIAPRILAVAGDLTAPLSADLVYPQPVARSGEHAVAATVASGSLLAIIALVVWACGAAFVAGRWLLRWLEVRRALRASVVLPGIEFPVPVRATPEPFEPGLIGIFRRVLLVPQGIEQHLTPEQMRAVLAHEQCHLRDNDNLSASIHMLVETLFWFYPVVWWIGGRIIEERERACDEHVVRDGHAPRSYAEAILAVCEHYIASRLPSVSGVSGADLRKRIDVILKNTVILRLGLPKKALLTATISGAVAVPITAGILSGNPMHMVFSSAYSAAMDDYWKAGIALGKSMEDSRSASGVAAERCAEPDAQFLRRRRALAASVRKLGSADGDKVVLFAVAANSTRDVQRLLDGGASRSGDGLILADSLMHVAARYADTPMLELLAESGFSMDERGTEGIAPKGRTPLMTAISAGRMANTDWLIRHGANLSAEDKYGNTALLFAMIDCRDQTLVTRLVEAGAVPNAKARRIARSMHMSLGPATPQSATAPPIPPLPGRPSNTPAPLTGDELEQRWQAPSAVELAAQPWREPSATHYLKAMGDFDGDGIADHAIVRVLPLSARSGGAERVFVQLSSLESGNWQTAAGIAHLDRTTVSTMGISVAKPGTYATACGKGYWTCAEGEPSAVTLQYPGIQYFKPEGASSLVYWDGQARRFQQVWISD